jgi:Protein of unknown function (DUF1350)
MLVGSSFFALMTTTAFSTELNPSSSSTNPQNSLQRYRHNHAAHASPSTTRQSFISNLAMAAADGNSNDDEEAERRSGNPAIELSSTLARLDRQFQIQQRDKPGSRWTKLVLQPEDNDEDGGGTENKDPMSPIQQQQDFVYLLEPPNKSNPSCIICFTGGAGLGSFPQVAYNEFLLRLSNRLNAAILTAPYSVGLDHFALAKSVGELHRRALIACQDDPSRLYSPNLRTYCVAHSLGCKLATIYMAATGQEYDGVAFMSFNNFGFGQTIGMAREFTQQIRQSSMGGGGSGGAGGGFGGVGSGFESFMGNAAGAMSGDTMDSIFNFAQSLLGNIGIEFSPNPSDMERLIALRYAPERQAKTRLFVFDDDTLDSTPSFLRACRSSSRRAGSVDNDADDDDDKDKDVVQVSALPGTHLTPVYFKLALEELIEDEEARNVARGLALEQGIPEAASFGNEQEMNALIDEVCGFILGKGPTRPSRPLLSTSSSTSNTAGGGTDDSS